ncbi:hypothetical protein I308_101443 [Cryptococcus tetragattii IND107]|uniref:Uncharacterized protein n=1 Tax=Cryptococcus tetragattii IND107 TaxID=1296105 RepID=A0ABR3C3H0_9TREE
MYSWAHWIFHSLATMRQLGDLLSHTYTRGKGGSGKCGEYTWEFGYKDNQFAGFLPSADIEAQHHNSLAIFMAGIRSCGQLCPGT